MTLTLLLLYCVRICNFCFRIVLLTLGNHGTKKKITLTETREKLVTFFLKQSSLFSQSQGFTRCYTALNEAFQNKITDQFCSTNLLRN